MKNPDFDHHARFVELVKTHTPDPVLGPFILTWLQAPPNLAFICSLLTFTVQILRNQSDRVQRLIPAIQHPDKLADDLEELARRSNEIQRIIGPDALLPIARVKSTASHPHRNYCLSICHYWSGVFYTPESGGDAEKQAYEQTFEEFSVCLWIITTKCDPRDYMQWAEKWRSKEDSLEDMPAIFGINEGKMRRAALAIRLLTQAKFKPLFDQLCFDQYGPNLPNRVYSALKLGEEYWNEAAQDYVGVQSESDQKSDAKNAQNAPRYWKRLIQIASLMASTIPGWKWPDELKGRRIQPPKPGITRRTNEGDGFVRLADTDWLVEEVALDEGPPLKTYQTASGEPESIDDDPALDDYLNEPHLIETVEDRSSAHGGLSVRSVKTMAQARHLAKFYLMMPRPYPLPTSREIELITSRLKAVREGHAPAGVEHLVVCGALSLGRPYSEIAKLRLCKSSQKVSESIEYLVDQREWRITVTGPDLKDPEKYAGYDQLNFHNALPVSEVIRLPDHAGFGDMLSRLNTPTDEDFLLISRFTKAQKAKIDEWLTVVLGEQRMTKTALHKPMQRALVEHANADLAPMSLLTGQRHAHGLTTLHYSAYSAEHLRTLFSEANKKVLGDLFVESVPVTECPVKYYGNPTQPIRSAVENLVAHYLVQLQTVDPADDLDHYNDLYVLYTIVLLYLGQARRPVVSPGFHGLTSKSGAGTWSDKARNEAQRRGAFLPSMVKTQLEYFLGHVQAMCGHRAEYHSQIVQGHRFLLCHHYDDESAGGSGPAPGKRALPMRPKHFRLASQDFFGLPLYSLRRFVRMALILDHQVSGELVDAVMGHMRMGLSPFEPLATFPASQLQGVAEGPLEKMLTNLGARPVRSKLVAHG